MKWANACRSPWKTRYSSLNRIASPRASEAACSGRYGLVILDEGCYAVARDLISEEFILRLLKEAAPGVTIVLTGRGATQRLIAAADTVSEIRCVKHGFDAGRTAQKGVEY